MPIATNAQMQVYCDERLRRRAEQFRAVVAALRDDRSAIDDVYARAAQNPGTRWNDARTDGPPHLLQSGYDGTTPASPDDVLNFNTFAAALCDILDGVGTDATNAANLRSCWAVLVDACVRPIGG